MKQKIIFIILIGLLVLTLPNKAVASTEVAGQSAQLKKVIYSKDEYYKKLSIERVLRKSNSPLVSQAETFITVARALELDPYLLPSITGVESGFARAMIKSTYNPFGFGKGQIPFDNWADGIAKVGYALRFKYINRGAVTLDQIGHRYAGGSTTWAPKVNNFMNAFEAEEARIKKYQNILES